MLTTSNIQIIVVNSNSLHYWHSIIYTDLFLILLKLIYVPLFVRTFSWYLFIIYSLCILKDDQKQSGVIKSMIYLWANQITPKGLYDIFVSKSIDAQKGFMIYLWSNQSTPKGLDDIFVIKSINAQRALWYIWLHPRYLNTSW